MYLNGVCVSFPSGITVLLSLTVFMLMVAEIMPATSDSVPLIGQSLLLLRAELESMDSDLVE